jgi:hypothetical protein
MPGKMKMRGRMKKMPKKMRAGGMTGSSKRMDRRLTKAKMGKARKR